MTTWRTVGRPLCAAALGLTLGSCGDDGPGSCPAGQTGTPPNCQVVCPAGTIPPNCQVDCTQTNIYQNNGSVPAFTLVFFDFSVPDSGRLDVTMDWTNAASLMGFYLVPANTCTVDEFNARSCNFVMRSEPSSVKPRKVSQANLTVGNGFQQIELSEAQTNRLGANFTLRYEAQARVVAGGVLVGGKAGWWVTLSTSVTTTDRSTYGATLMNIPESMNDRLPYSAGLMVYPYPTDGHNGRFIVVNFWVE